jgi:hypothetical protein
LLYFLDIDNTYGGLKNCSINTHMPLAISVMRKYFDALSRALSWPGESHRVGFGIRKPAGGGPEGSAALRELVEKVAAGVARRDAGNVRVRGLEFRASAESDRVVAIAVIEERGEMWPEEVMVKLRC